MSLFIASLNSGSNGNCYYVGNSNEAVLIDAGISCRETEKRMQRLGLRMNNIKAIFISHEHTDHISGVATLSAKYQLPVYITATTLKHCEIYIDKKYCIDFFAYEPVQIGELFITPFPKKHDGIHPHSFVVSCNGLHAGVFTDIGTPCENVIHYFKQCHAVFLEANYDTALLERGGYPLPTKKRIRSDEGHLSNTQALDLFLEHQPACMSHLILSHLSANNNKPAIAEQLFAPYSDRAKIIVASRYKETELFAIDGDRFDLQHPKKRMQAQVLVQLSLFT